MTHALLVIHVALCVALWYSVFCRAVRSDRTVRLDVRLSMFLLGAVALLLMLAPFRWDWRPDWLTVLLLLAIVVVQGVTAAHWRDGVPEAFLKPGCRRTFGRRAGDSTEDATCPHN